MFYKSQFNKILAEGEEPEKQAEGETKAKAKKKKVKFSKALSKNPGKTALGLGGAAATGFLAHKLLSGGRRQEYNQQYASYNDELVEHINSIRANKVQSNKSNFFVNYLFSQDYSADSTTAQVLFESRQ